MTDTVNDKEFTLKDGRRVLHEGIMPVYFVAMDEGRMTCDFRAGDYRVGDVIKFRECYPVDKDRGHMGQTDNNPPEKSEDGGYEYTGRELWMEVTFVRIEFETWPGPCSEPWSSPLVQISLRKIEPTEEMKSIRPMEAAKTAAAMELASQVQACNSLWKEKSKLDRENRSLCDEIFKLTRMIRKHLSEVFGSAGEKTRME